MTTDLTDSRQWIFVNAHAVAGLPSNDRGFLYGDGLFETMRVSSGQIPLLDFHIERLLRGCSRLAIAVSRERILDEINHSLQSVSPDLPASARCRLTLTRGAGVNASYPFGCSAPNITIHISSTSAESLFAKVAQVDLVPATLPLPTFSALAGLKHLNRLPYILACLGVNKAPHQEVFFCDEAGRIIETLHHNIFFIEGNNLITPKIEHCGVEGVMRKVVLQRLAVSCGLRSSEQDVDIDEIAEFESCFLTNAFAGIVKVKTLSGYEFSHLDRADLLVAELQKFMRGCQ